MLPPRVHFIPAIWAGGQPFIPDVADPEPGFRIGRPLPGVEGGDSERLTAGAKRLPPSLQVDRQGEVARGMQGWHVEADGRIALGIAHHRHDPGGTLDTEVIRDREPRAQRSLRRAGHMRAEFVGDGLVRPGDGRGETRGGARGLQIQRRRRHREGEIVEPGLARCMHRTGDLAHDPRVHRSAWDITRLDHGVAFRPSTVLVGIDAAVVARTTDRRLPLSIAVQVDIGPALESHGPQPGAQPV